VQADLIIYAVVAAGLVFWLRSILGTRHGDERERPNPFNTPATESAADANKMAIDDDLPIVLDDRKAELPPNVAIASASVESALGEIMDQDPSFQISKFSLSAQDAFAMIVEAFAAGERETLRDLLEPQVYNAFDSAITAREEKGETMVNQIHAVKNANILNARIEDRTAYVTIQFIAQETCVIKDRDGNITFGNPDRVTEMNDVWTFSHQLRSNDPRWMLHETRDGDHDHKNMIPDSV